MMYNRYVPQPDGSYIRKHQPEPPAPPPPPPPAAPPPPPEAQTPPPPPVTSQRQNPKPGFLQQLLPKDFDTGDLIVLLLLLLMAGDRPEDKNNAILTMALYLLM